MSVRLARRADAEVIARLAADLVGEADAETIRQALEALDPTRAAVFVSERDEMVVGFCYVLVLPLLLNRRAWARLASMAVDQNRRRQGVGRELVRAAEEFSRQSGADSIELTSGTHRLEAHQFYLSTGYAETANSKWFARSL